MVTAPFGGAMMYVAGDNSRHFALGLSYLGLGAGWALLGVFAVLPRLWAVYAGLAWSYLSLLTNLQKVNPCGIVIVAILILYAHWVISRAKSLRAAGHSLTANM